MRPNVRNAIHVAGIFVLKMLLRILFATKRRGQSIPSVDGSKLEDRYQT